MNDYIENKLKEFDEQVEKIESFEWDARKEREKYMESDENMLFFGFEYPESQFELEPEKVREFLKQSLTDYHNHIVEKIKTMKKGECNHMTNYCQCEHTGYKYALDDIYSFLQDTNPKE